MNQTPQTRSQYRVILIGCGKMGGALIQGWDQAGLLKRAEILDPGGIPDSLMNLQSLFHVKRAEMLGFEDSDIVTLAVKPQIMTTVCQGLKDLLPPGLPVLSIAAGKSTTYFRQQFSSGTPVIRAMPNTPAAIGKGIAALYATEAVNESQKQMAEDLMAASGQSVWLEDEEQMDAVTALSGSGPAYVFYLIEAMTIAGEKAGLQKDTARKLARQTVIGAAALAEQEKGLPASILRENVTSPGGTTEAALQVLMNGEFQDLMDKAIAAATARSKELSD
jgi:pyrroline-5-carboxylate reductase